MLTETTLCCNASDCSTDKNDEFPTPESLRQANEQCGETTLSFDDDGLAVPRPLWQKKDEIFVLENYKRLDDRACKVGSVF
jgi:hypothetical protein